MKIYLAARYDRKEEVAKMAVWLASLGFEMTCTWVKRETSLYDDVMGTEEGTLNALLDVEDVGRSDILVLLAEEPGNGSSRGGRHVEFGMAVALGLQLVVLGAKENIFHCLPYVKVVADRDALLDHLEGLRAILE